MYHVTLFLALVTDPGMDTFLKREGIALGIAKEISSLGNQELGYEVR